MVSDLLNATEDQTTLFGVSLINIDSNVQLKKALQKYGLELDSTDVNVLGKFKGVPVIDELLAYRKAQKFISTYGESLMDKINEFTGRLHTRFRQMVSTGRMSSSAPNLQNVLVGAVAGYEIRRGFVVPPGYTWVKIDYSQIELRVLAHMLVELFGDWSYAQIFLDGGDIHRDTAAVILGLSSADVQKAERRLAKAINFGIIYGQSPGGLMYSLNSTYQEALDFYNTYMTSYPGIERWMVWQKDFGDQHGYVETPFFKTRRYVRKGEHTLMLNTPIQAGAAEIIRKAMNEVQQFIETSNSRARMLLQVHDELDFEVPDEELEWFIPSVVRIMGSTVKMAVPLEVEVEIGDNWGELPHQTKSGAYK